VGSAPNRLHATPLRSPTSTKSGRAERRGTPRESPLWSGPGIPQFLRAQRSVAAWARVIGTGVAASITSGSVTSWVSPSADTVACPATALSRCRLRQRLRRGVHVDGINTSGVSARHLASFGVVSRSQFRCFPSSTRFLSLVRFPAAPPKGPQMSGPFPLGRKSLGDPASMRLHRWIDQVDLDVTAGSGGGGEKCWEKRIRWFTGKPNNDLQVERGMPRSSHGVALP
jgi:hypothetical protein